MLSANRPFFKLSIVTAALLGLAALPPAAVAQHEHDNPSGYPLDWSNSHVKFRPAGNLQDQKNFEKDPRYLRHRDEERRKWEKLADDDASRRGRDHWRTITVEAAMITGRKIGKGDSLTVDWAVSLANGSVAQNMSPALFSTTSSTTPACADMVVYGMNVAGAVAVPGAGQANLIGVNNLYGTGNGCTTNPNVAFAYALTTGTIATSPVSSYFDNGAQIAFVANESGKATLLEWSRTVPLLSGRHRRRRARRPTPGLVPRCTFNIRQRRTRIPLLTSITLPTQPTWAMTTELSTRFHPYSEEELQLSCGV